MAETITSVIAKIDNLGTTINEPFKTKQYDTASRFILFEFQNQDGQPYDLTNHEVILSAVKPDNSLIYNVIPITNAKLGQVKVELTTQFSAAIGLVECEINIYGWDNSQRLSTLTFYVEVEKSIQNAMAVVSKNEFNVLEELMQKYYEFWDFVRLVSERFGFPRDIDDTVFKLLYNSIDVTKQSFDYVYSINSSISNVNSNITRIAETMGTKLLSRINITSNQTWTVPTGVSRILVSAISAGGNGGTGNTSGGGGGGSAGNFIIERPFTVTPGQSISCTVGTGNTVVGSLITLVRGNNGGTGNASPPASGGAGTGATVTITIPNSLSSYISGGGGFGGGISTSKGADGTTAVDITSSNNTINLSNYGISTTADSGGGGGGCPWKFVPQTLLQSDITTNSGGGAGGTSGMAGSSAKTYGCGGGGGGKTTSGTTSGGTGSPGIIIIEW